MCQVQVLLIKVSIQVKIVKTFSQMIWMKWKMMIKLRRVVITKNQNQWPKANLKLKVLKVKGKTKMKTRTMVMKTHPRKILTQIITIQKIKSKKYLRRSFKI